MKEKLEYEMFTILPIVNLTDVNYRAQTQSHALAMTSIVRAFDHRNHYRHHAKQILTHKYKHILMKVSFNSLLNCAVDKH